MKVLFRILLLLCCLFLVAIILFAFVYRDRRPRIYFAAARGDTNAITGHLASGSNVNNAIGCYPFHEGPKAPLLDIAIEYGQLETVNFLIKNGANPNQTDSRGDTPLSWAIGRIKNEVTNETRLQILRTLLKAGADPNLKASSEYHYPPLLNAASWSEQPEMVSILLASGAHVDGTNSVGQTALHLTRNVEVARILIAAGANRNVRTTFGETPADSAVRDGRFQVLAVLTNEPAQHP